VEGRRREEGRGQGTLLTKSVKSTLLVEVGTSLRPFRAKFPLGSLALKGRKEVATFGQSALFAAFSCWMGTERPTGRTPGPAGPGLVVYFAVLDRAGEVQWIMVLRADILNWSGSISASLHFSGTAQKWNLVSSKCWT